MHVIGKIKRIPIEKIDLLNRDFKISRNIYDDALVKSIRDNGVLEPPLLMEGGGGLTVIFGFNRIEVLRYCDEKMLDAVIVPSLKRDEYVRTALSRCFKNEVGPLGKLRLLGIMKNYFKTDEGELIDLSRRALFVPEDFIVNDLIADTLARLPCNLRNYLDFKDVPYRVIKQCLELPVEALGQMDQWLQKPLMRVNIFKKIADMLSDISLRDGKYSPVQLAGDVGASEDKRRDEVIYEALRRIRFPEYTGLKDRADAIASSLTGAGIGIELPKYFEGDHLRVIINIKKDEDPAILMKKIRSLDREKLQELLDLL